MKGEAGSTAHPTAGTYVAVALVLTVVTLVEFSILYVPGLAGAAVPILLILSAVKFALVALFYMHLRFDDPLYRRLFAGGLVLGILVAVSLGTLSHMRM